MNNPLLGESLALFQVHRRPLTRRELRAYKRMKARQAKQEAKIAARNAKQLVRRQKEEALRGNPLPFDDRGSTVSAVSSAVRKVQAKELLLR